MSNANIKQISIVLFIALVWVVFYQLNIFLFNFLNWKEMITWIFLPSGIRLVAVIIFAELGVFGLFLGSLGTYYLNHFTIGNPFVLASLSALSPLLAVIVSRFMLKLDHLFTNLTAKGLLFISLMSAAFNSTLHQCYFHIRDLEGFMKDEIVMFIGDFFGSLLVLMLMSIIIKYIKYSYRRPT